jgi:CheY-like chemotaxis protein
LSAGYNDYITKPVQPVQLVRLLAEHLTNKAA